MKEIVVSKNLQKILKKILIFKILPYKVSIHQKRADSCTNKKYQMKKLFMIKIEGATSNWKKS